MNSVKSLFKRGSPSTLSLMSEADTVYSPITEEGINMMGSVLEDTTRRRNNIIGQSYAGGNEPPQNEHSGHGDNSSGGSGGGNPPDQTIPHELLLPSEQLAIATATQNSLSNRGGPPPNTANDMDTFLFNQSAPLGVGDITDTSNLTPPPRGRSEGTRENRQCYSCQEYGHIARNCTAGSSRRDSNNRRSVPYESNPRGGSYGRNYGQQIATNSSAGARGQHQPKPQRENVNAVHDFQGGYVSQDYNNEGSHLNA